MLVKLKDLQPNPLRDFRVDPLNPEQVTVLTKSIKEHDFWGGVVCRKVDDEIQVVSGWHRVKAAIKAGIEKADLFVNTDMDDANTIQVYAIEDGSQKGRTTAQTGAVAAAIRYLAKAVLLETSEKFFGRSLQTAQGQILTDKGIGIDLVVRFLNGCPGINEGSVRQQLALLKASGDYGRIIEEVKIEIELENQAALDAEREAERERQEAEMAKREQQEAEARERAAKEEKEKQRAEQERKKAEAKAAAANRRRDLAERKTDKHKKALNAVKNARKAASKANQDKPTFDLEGVRPYFENAHQLDVFRKTVTGKKYCSILPVNKQAALARAIVEYARTLDKHITADFISETIDLFIEEAKGDFRRLIKEEERKKLAAANWEDKLIALQKKFASETGQLLKVINELVEHNKNRPGKQLTFFRTGEFREATKLLGTIVSKLDQL